MSTLRSEIETGKSKRWRRNVFGIGRITYLVFSTLPDASANLSLASLFRALANSRCLFFLFSSAVISLYIVEGNTHRYKCTNKMRRKLKRVHPSKPCPTHVFGSNPNNKFLVVRDFSKTLILPLFMECDTS